MIFSNESMNLSNLTFRLDKETCSEAIEGKTSLTGGGKILTFIPGHDLLLSTKYYASLKYSSGNEKKWSFRLLHLSVKEKFCRVVF